MNLELKCDYCGAPISMIDSPDYVKLVCPNCYCADFLFKDDDDYALWKEDNEQF